MRATTLFAMLVMGIAALIVVPSITTGQFQQGGGGFGGKGKGKGGFGGGGFGGGMQQDPASMFEFLSKGRGYFVINETMRMRQDLTTYAQEKGISNGQITREQFLDFYPRLQAKVAGQGGGGGPSPGGFGGGGFGKKGFDPANGPGGFGGGGFGKKGFGGGDQALSASPEVQNQFIESEFKSRDRNGDGKLNAEEMPGSLRDNLARWDKNGDNLIDLEEFKAYAAARNEERGAKGIAAIVIDDDELDRKPVVFRAGGKMPAGLPRWFKELDKDEDGQVAQYEWRRAGKPMDEFKLWDLNDDGFITLEEAMKQQAVLSKDETKNTTASLSNSNGGNGGDSPQRPQMNGKRGFGGGDPNAEGGGNPFGGFGKGNKGNKGGFGGKKGGFGKQPEQQ